MAKKRGLHSTGVRSYTPFAVVPRCVPSLDDCRSVSTPYNAGSAELARSVSIASTGRTDRMQRGARVGQLMRLNVWS